MTTLVSPGVSVTVVDESFYIPASAPTVPLIFIATKNAKKQPDEVTDAAGTFEHGVVRTVTSVGQSVQLYGVPHFHTNSSGNARHGDARNEYGLFALNQFLGVGNLAYAVRANVNLDDDIPDFFRTETLDVVDSAFTGTGNGTIGSISAGASIRPQDITVTFTSATKFNVVGSLDGFVGIGTVGTAFSSSVVNLTVTAGATAFVAGDEFTFSLANVSVPGGGNVGNGSVNDITLVVNTETGEQYALEEFDIDGDDEEEVTISFTSATEFSVTSDSFPGGLGTGVVGTQFTGAGVYANVITFTIEAGTTAFAIGDTFTITLELKSQPATNDAARRAKIVTALAGAINSNADVRSEIYEYNLILCPGYPEVVTNLVALSADVNEEAFVIADTPMNLNPEQTAQWSLTSNRTSGTNVAYYYPAGLAANLDGAEVAIAASGIALRTFAYSDNQSYVWFAPAGVSRGSVTGVNRVGYVSGSLNSSDDVSNTFVEVNLNQGQRDNLYQSFKNINPIVFFPGQGLIVWGQKTSAGAASALDRVNVVRLVMYVKRQLRKGAFPFVFEPNDKITRDNLKAASDGFLNDILAKRGLYDFVTLCDTSNNTPTVIDNNQLIMDVALQPVKAAEFIYIPIRILSTGAALPS